MKSTTTENSTGGCCRCELCGTQINPYANTHNCQPIGITTNFEMHIDKKVIMNRVRAMPSFATFTIKPIKELLERYNVGKNWIDPFAGENSPAGLRNDHNPSVVNVEDHQEAMDFCQELKNKGYSFEGVLFDPPYSYRQVSEHYKVIGKKATQLDTSTQFYNRVLNPLSDLVKSKGYCISFGWNSNGMGKNRGFEIVEILLVAHGGHHNDTIVVVEQKL